MDLRIGRGHSYFTREGPNTIATKRTANWWQRVCHLCSATEGNRCREIFKSGPSATTTHFLSWAHICEPKTTSTMFISEHGLVYTLIKLLLFTHTLGSGNFILGLLIQSVMAEKTRVEVTNAYAILYVRQPKTTAMRNSTHGWVSFPERKLWTRGCYNQWGKPSATVTKKINHSFDRLVSCRHVCNSCLSTEYNQPAMWNWWVSLLGVGNVHSGCHKTWSLDDDQESHGKEDIQRLDRKQSAKWKFQTRVILPLVGREYKTRGRPKLSGGKEKQ